MTDAQIAREWAWEYMLCNEGIPESERDAEYMAARYILDTTAPPTMADVEWDDDVHAGLCAEHTECGLVRMMNRVGAFIECFLEDGTTPLLRADKLTPIPGTRLDLAPRREPESTPKHPEVLATRKDYENAPTGTIVAEDSSDPWIKGNGFWLGGGDGWGDTSPVMAFVARRVLRWGESLHKPVPTHPTALVTEDDYRGAPYGTVVWGNGPSSNMSSSMEKYGNAWLESGDDGTFTPRHMAAAGPHQVLRWGDVS